MRDLCSLLFVYLVIGIGFWLSVLVDIGAPAAYFLGMIVIISLLKWE